MLKLIKQNKPVTILLSIGLVSTISYGTLKFITDYEEQDFGTNDFSTTQLVNVNDVINDEELPLYDNSNFLEEKERYPDLAGILVGDVLPGENHRLRIMNDDTKGTHYLDSSLFGDISNLGYDNSLSVVGGHNTPQFLGNMANNPDQAHVLYLYTEDNAYELDLIDIRTAVRLSLGTMNDQEMNEHVKWLNANSDTGFDIDVPAGSSIISIYCCIPGTSGAEIPDRMVFDYVARNMCKKNENTNTFVKRL